MAKAMYAVIGGTTKKIKSAYAVVGGVTRKLKAVYAVVGGTTKLVWKSGPDFSINIENIAYTGIHCESNSSIDWDSGGTSYDYKSTIYTRNDSTNTATKIYNDVNLDSSTRLSINGQYGLSSSIPNTSTKLYYWNGSGYTAHSWNKNFRNDFTSFSSALSYSAQKIEIAPNGKQVICIGTGKFHAAYSMEIIIYDINSDYSLTINQRIEHTPVSLGSSNSSLYLYGLNLTCSYDFSVICVYGYAEWTYNSNEIECPYYVVFTRQDNGTYLKVKEHSWSYYPNDLNSNSSYPYGYTGNCYVTPDGKYIFGWSLQEYQTGYLSMFGCPFVNNVTSLTALPQWSSIDFSPACQYSPELEVLTRPDGTCYKLSETSMTKIGTYSSWGNPYSRNSMDMNYPGTHIVYSKGSGQGGYAQLSRNSSNLITGKTDLTLPTISHDYSDDYSFYLIQFIDPR